MYNASGLILFLELRNAKSGLRLRFLGLGQNIGPRTVPVCDRGDAVKWGDADENIFRRRPSSWAARVELQRVTRVWAQPKACIK